MTARQTQGANKQPQRRAAVRHHVLLPAVAAKPSPCTVCLTSNPPPTTVRASTWSAKCDAACERRAGIPDCPHLTPAPQLPCCGPACLELPAIRIRAVLCPVPTPVPGRCAVVSRPIAGARLGITAQKPHHRLGSPPLSRASCRAAGLGSQLHIRRSI